WWAGLHAYPGTTLSYESGATVAASLYLQDENPPQPGFDGTPAAIHWRVDQGMASHIGPIHGTVPLIKLGTGTLQLLDATTMPGSHLTVAEGTVQLENQFAGQIHITNAATLSGSGRVGWLTTSPGGILAPSGRMTVDNQLLFEPGSELHIRAWANGQ